MIAPPDVHPPVAAAPKPRRRGLFAFAAAAALVLVVVGAVGVLALLRALDFGDRMASAEAMPPGTQLYVDIDFGSLDDLDRLLLTFDAAFAEAEIAPGLDGVVDLIDDELRAQFGIGVDDVTPWVGRDVGLGVAGIEIDSTGTVDATLVAAVAVKDGAGADEFVDRMVGILADRDLTNFTESTYQDVRIRASSVDLDGMQLVVARSGDLLLLGNNEAAVRSAIDAQAGPSLADDAAMDDLLAALPSDRAVTVYVAESLFEDLGDDLTGLLPEAVTIPYDEVGALAMSVALTADGIQLDVVQPRDPAETGLAASVTGPGSAELPGLLPHDTFAYLGFAGDEPLLGEDVSIEGMLQEAGVTETELAEVRAALDEFESFVGFDIENDLLRQLGGDLGIALLPASEPLAGDPGAPHVGFLAMIGVMDPVAVGDVAADFRAFLADQGVPVADRQAADATLYAVGDGENDFVMLGVAGDYVVAASDEGDVAGLFEDSAKLADNERYQDAAMALPQRGDPVLFLDMPGALAALDAPPEVVEMLAPVAGVVANADETDTTYRFTLLTLIDY